MIAYAAIDLRGGRVVQLVGGRPERERISLPNSLDVARRWVDEGFRALHVVDLDAALGTGTNRGAILRILREIDVPVQVGGGLRDDESVAALLEAGAVRVVVGTRAVEEPAWLEALAGRWPGRIVVAADICDGLVVTRGWTVGTGLEAATLLERLDPLPLGGVLVTDVSREGQMTGADVNRFAALVVATRHPLIASGGIRDIEDLRELARWGVAGAVLGMSLYTGAVDPRATTLEFGA